MEDVPVPLLSLQQVGEGGADRGGGGRAGRPGPGAAGVVSGAALGDGVDAHPSCQLYPASNRFHCFACGNHCDVIDFVQQVRGEEFAAAVAWLGGVPATSSGPVPAGAWRGSDTRVVALRELLEVCGAPSHGARANWCRRGVSAAVHE
jgi:hypothetical protein